MNASRGRLPTGTAILLRIGNVISIGANKYVIILYPVMRRNSARRSIFLRLRIVGELLRFFWERKLWWLIPMIVVLLFFGILLVFAQTTAVGPFIYTLF